MDLFYACSTKHVKHEVANISCLCLLGHAKVYFRMKKKMSPAQKAAQILSKLGASKGGKARAKTLSLERRKAIAQKAARARWADKSKNGV
jgi:hypothetical protein